MIWYTCTPHSGVAEFGRAEGSFPTPFEHDEVTIKTTHVKTCHSRDLFESIEGMLLELIFVVLFIGVHCQLPVKVWETLLVAEPRQVQEIPEGFVSWSYLENIVDNNTSNYAYTSGYIYEDGANTIR